MTGRSIVPSLEDFGSTAHRTFEALRDPRLRSVGCALLWLAVSAWVIWADAISALNVSFPVTYLLPVLLAAHAGHRRMALALAVGMPVARFEVQSSMPGPDPLIAYVIESFVLGFVAILVGSERRQSRHHHVPRMCAWCNRIHAGGERWEPFTEVVCPACLEKCRESLSTPSSPVPR
jgi:hypothetical protein